MKWTEAKVKKLIELDKLNYPNYAIAEYFGCSLEQIKSKLANWRKKNNQYNLDHIKEKYEINTDFFYDLDKPKTIFDPFCGKNRFWKSKFEKEGIIVLDNDKDINIEADLHEDAKVLLDNFVRLNFEFDIVDIDPFGECFDYIENGIRLAKMGLIITNGFIKNGTRFRPDYWEKKYGKGFLPNIKHLIRFIQKIGRENGKVLEVYGVPPKNWKNCDRIWFTIKRDDDN